MIAMLSGSFDPPTLGHLDIIRRSAKLYDRLFVVISENIYKKSLFSAQERKELLEALLKDLDNVEVVIHRGLVVEFARSHEITVMIRGVRALNDFGYEFELAMTNRELLPSLEVLFMPTDPKFFLLRSSAIKEIATFGGDISAMVDPLVAAKLQDKLAKDVK